MLFNVICFHIENLGGTGFNQAMLNFFEFIEGLNLIDLPLEGGTYTWTNGFT